MSTKERDYFVSRLVQNLEDNFYDSEERIQRLRLQNDELADENKRLRGGIEVIRDRCATLAKNAQEAGIRTLASEMDINAKSLTGLLKGDWKH